MLEGFIEALGDVLFDVVVWMLRLSSIVLIARLTFWLLGVPDTLFVALTGLKILFLGE